MNKEKCYYLGEIIKTHGFKGEVQVIIDERFSADLEKMEVVFLEIDEILVPFFVLSIAFIKDDLVLLHLDDIGPKEKAATYIHTKLFIPRAEVSGKPEKSVEYNNLSGYTVIDQKHGNLGKVTEFIDVPGNPLLQIEGHFDSPIYIPVHGEEIFLTIDTKKKILYVSLPEGLLEA